MVLLYVITVLFQMLQFTPPSVNAAPTDLKVYAEAASFARLDGAGFQDPSGWFFQAVLYNPTSTDIVVNGLRWWYNSSVQIIDTGKPPFDARCYDTRFFSALPSTTLVGNREIRWEYAAGTISLPVPARKMVLTWIEVPTKSIDNAALTLATYYVQARVGNQWLFSPIYPSHGGDNSAVSTVFREDFNLTTSPNGEAQTHPNPQWLFKEDRSVVAGLSRRIRLIPVASGKGQGINSASVNMTLPTGWSYVANSSYNPYGENIAYYTVGGRDRLKWSLNRDVSVYSTNQSIAQNYIEFNATTPSNPGIYNFTITSTVTSISGLTVGENQFIYAYVMSPPTASFTFLPSTPLVNQSVTFNASSSSDLDGVITNYSWNFGDGQTATGAVVSHAFSSLGNKTVTLTVTDNDGLVGTKSSILQVIKAPVASFTFSPSNPLVNKVVTFNASSSTPNGGDIVNYFWNFGDNQTDTGVIATHAYSEIGNYSVVLNITDSEGVWDTETKQIIVANTPLATFTYSPSRPLVNQSIIFNASLSAPNGGFILEYYWDFGDGEVDLGEVLTHSYADFGNYTVTLTIIDSEGLNDTDTKIIRVYSSPFVFFTYSPQQPSVSSPVTFNATASKDSDGNIALYRWDFGDGNITDAYAPTITHVYAVAGDFTVFLTVCDNDGYNDTAAQTLTIVVHNIAIISITPSATEVQAGQQVNITVVVQNKGTTSETFNVTVYFNQTTIGTQLVEGLAPNTEIILTFAWNTAGLADGSVYTTEAETSLIIDEMDTSDNNAQGGIVKIASSLPPPLEPTPSSFLDTILPYAIPIGAVIASILLLAVVTTLKKTGKPAATPVKALPSEFQPFTDLIGGELPDAYSVMIIGEASAGKSILCQQLANKYVNQGKPCVYVTYDCFPDEIRSNMKNLGWDIAPHEQNGLFAFVDGYSPIAGKASPEKYSLKQPFALSELGIGISIAVGELTQKSPRVFLDSTVPLFSRLDPGKVAEFLQDRSAQIKGENGIFFFTIGQGTIPQDLQRRLEEIVDCIIDLEVKEHKGETVRRLRIRRMRGRPFSDQWIKFSVDKKKGFLLSSSRQSLKGGK